MKKLLSFAVIAVFTIALAVGCSKPAAGGDAVKMKDGTYKATYSHLDGKGWKPAITIEVKDGKIVKADYDYFNLDGKRKSQDADYNTRMKAKSGVGPAEYVVKFNESLVKNQAADKIDAVAGATSSHKHAVALAKAAIEAAAKGDTKEVILPTNDTYTAKGATDERGWTPQVSITFENDKITKVVLEELDKDGKKKSENAEYNTNMKAKSGVSFKEAAETLSKKYLETGKADTVAGATSTSSKFAELVEKAKAMRK